MNIDQAFPSKYLKAGDLPEEGTKPLTISKVSIEEIGMKKDRKPVLYFENQEKGLVCNKTNARLISRVTGSGEFEDWIGKSIQLYRAEVEFQGDMVESIRVRVKFASRSQPKPSAPPVDSEGDPLLEERPL